MSWVDKNKSTKKGAEKWYVFAGRAYPRIVEGSNSTTRVTSDINDRTSFYNDPAVVLSDADLNRFNGAEGKPLCVEHDLNDKVGYVHHSWIGDGKKRALKIIGRVSLETERGREVVRDIKAGKLNGLSVGYGTDLVSNWDNKQTELMDKNFREISLVFAPFFDGCDLAEMGVTATKNPNHNNFEKKSHLLLRVDASREILMEQNQPSAAPTPTPVPASELLSEVDKMKSQLSEETQEMAKLKAELEELRALKDQVVAKEKADAEAYEIAQTPKYEAYVAELAASGTVVTEAQKKGFRATFCNPKYKEGANHLWAHHTQQVELKASLKTLEERAKNAEEAQKKLEAAVNKTTQVLNHSRSEFAAALNPKDAAREDEGRRKVPNGGVVGAEVDVNASGGLRRIMAPEPSLEETEFMRMYGFSNSSGTGVTASSFQQGSRQRITSLPVAASHSLIQDEEGNLNNPSGARHGDDSHQLLFSWMEKNPHMHGDLSDIVKMREDKNVFIKRDPRHPMMFV